MISKFAFLISINKIGSNLFGLSFFFFNNNNNNNNKTFSNKKSIYFHKQSEGIDAFNNFIYININITFLNC